MYRSDIAVASFRRCGVFCRFADILAFKYHVAVNVSDRAAGLVDNISDAVFACLYIADDIVKELLVGNDINAADRFTAGNAVFPERSCNDDRYLARYL